MIVIPETSLAAQLALKPPPAKVASGRSKVKCRLREFREAVPLSTQQVADGAGLSPRTINLTERGLSPTLVTALKIAGFFGVKVDDIWQLLE